jgi:hypothetical protein
VTKDTEGVLQLSVAVGAVHVATAVVPVVVKFKVAGQAVNTGAVASVAHAFVLVTVTVKLHIAILLAPSIAI